MLEPTEHTPYGTQFYLGKNRGDVRAFAHAVIDAGASIVLGSGPYVIRGVERYHLSAQDFPTDHWTIRSDGVFGIPATARRQHRVPASATHSPESGRTPTNSHTRSPA